MVSTDTESLYLHPDRNIALELVPKIEELPAWPEERPEVAAEKPAEDAAAKPAEGAPAKP